MRRLRARANGNVLDLSDDGEAEALLASGIYEEIDGSDGGGPVRKDLRPEEGTEPASPSSTSRAQKKGRYERRDMRAGE